MRTLVSSNPQAAERDAVLCDVALGGLASVCPEPGGPVLVVGAGLDAVAAHLDAERWRRRARPGAGAKAWPTGGPFSAAVLRPPRSKDELEMTLHAVASVLEPDAPVVVVGHNDEGIKGAARRVREVFGLCETVDTRRHCRVLRAQRTEAGTPLVADLDGWSRTSTFPVVDGPLDLQVWPGMFAKGSLDAGTELLLGALTDLPEAGTVLDFGCGSGVIGAVLQRRHPGLQLQCLDADAVAAHAAQRNVPGALVRCGASWSSLPAYKRYDAIVSNPPIHMGKHRDYRVLVMLIEEGGLRLADGGSLWLVVQRQVPVERTLQDWWASVELVAEDTRFRVWRAQQPFD